MLAVRASSASPPRRPRLCPACGCSSRRSPLPAKRKSPDDDPLLLPTSARVDVDDERGALRKALARQREAIEDLRRDLEEERSASSGAASEAMSMILRLQREKAEVQMEARQFRQFADDKIAHDLHQIASLEDACLRRDQAIEALLVHLHAYRNRLLALGIDPDSSPQPRCVTPAEDGHPYPGDNTHALTEIEQRISEMERGGAGGDLEEVMDKTVIGSSPRHSRRMSVESVGSFPEIHPREQGTAGDDASDRVYTVDAVHGAWSGVLDECSSTPRGSVPGGCEEGDIRKLYLRLQALEADRESLKREVVSMRTEKAQVVLLKEIAENLSKGIGGAAQPPRKELPFFGLFSFLSALKGRLAPAIGLFMFLYWKASSRR